MSIKNMFHNNNPKGRTGSNIFYILAYIYMALPISIFILGWLKWYIAIPAFAIVVLTVISMCLNIPNHDWHITFDRTNIERFVLIGIVIALWVYFSGIGGAVYQNADQSTRNGIYEALVTSDWPIVRSYEIGGNSYIRGIMYYIGYWLPAALVGKLFGVVYGYFAQMVWAWLGIMLMYFLVCDHLKSVKVWPLWIFMGFGGLDFLGYVLMGYHMDEIWLINRLERWNMTYQFSNMTSQLFWVFNQAVPAWLATMLILRQKENRYIVSLLGMLLISSVFPFVGLLPFAAYLIFGRKYGGPTGGTVFTGARKPWFRDTFSWENILGGGVTGLISGLFLLGNTSSSSIAVGEVKTYLTASSIPMVVTRKVDIFIYIIFIVLEAGVYCAAIYRYQKKNPLFYVMMAWLLICPWIHVGVSQDFCMRASIPALVYLYLLVVETLSTAAMRKDRLIQTLLIIFLCIGAITAVNGLMINCDETMFAYMNRRDYAQVACSVDDIMAQGNFSGDWTSSFFYNHLAR